jgi:AraC-like DNA-binding protein
MATSNTLQDLHEARETLSKPFDGDAASYRRMLESLSKAVPFTQALVISTVPRAGTQIIQPGHVPEALLKGYSRDVFAQDRATWQVILQNKVLDAKHLWPDGEFESSIYFRLLLEPNGLKYLAAAPLKHPVLLGYPGALHLYRSEEEGEFKASELRALGEMTNLLDAALEKSREPRRRSACGKGAAWEHHRPCRQFIFDAAGRQQHLYKNETGALDDRLRASMKQQIQHRFASLNGEPSTSDRVELADANGELWAFRVVVFKQFPALGDGPFIFFCLQPDSCEWNTLRASDFQADPEVSRLIPTLKFMHSEFHRMPTLDEISAKAHLSPFHFHRRFTELLGQTPKHFLLGCQIHQAKTMLVERKKALATIAADCGFAHQSHFTSRFKQATGLTPTRWRKLAADMAKPERAGAEGVSCKA